MVFKGSEKEQSSAGWKILLIDDDKEDYLLTHAMLAEVDSRPFSLIWADGYTAGVDALQRDTYDVVLVDYDLGGRSGIDIIREASPGLQQLPFILFTGRGGYHVDIEAMQAGATLYLTKNEVNPLLLERFIRYAIQLKQNEYTLRVQQEAQKKTAERLKQELAERRRTEKALRESEIRYRALVTASSQVLYQMSPDWSEMRQLLGGNFLADTIDPNPHWMEAYIHSDDRDWVWQVIQQAVKNKEVFNLEHRVIRADGTLGWTSSRAVPVLDADGELVEWFGAASDITDRKNAEEAQLFRQLQHRLIDQREQERMKISRDLHDGPIQDLTAITFSMRCLLIDHPESRIAGELQEIETDLQKQISGLRNYAIDFRPPVLSKFGLTKTIQSHVENFQEIYPDIRVSLDLDHSITIPEDGTALALLRIHQEAMNNIRKHANSGKVDVTIRLYQNKGGLVFEIKDNGQGFSLPDQWIDFLRSGHLGLIGMMERAAAVGGRLDIDSKPGKGTRILATIPR
jgi:signal transduction histidine kinase